jgi:hypothetical protein
MIKFLNLTRTLIIQSNDVFSILIDLILKKKHRTLATNDRGEFYPGHGYFKYKYRKIKKSLK